MLAFQSIAFLVGLTSICGIVSSKLLRINGTLGMVCLGLCYHYLLILLVIFPLMLRILLDLFGLS